MNFVIPSIFTAIDRFSGPLRGMGNATQSFADRASSAVANVERSLNRHSDSLLKVSKNTAIAGTALLAPLVLATKEAAAFGTAVASFRTIVSDLDDKEFAPYEEATKRIGKEQKKTYSDVAAGFESIAGLNADFAKTADGLGQVSTASIILAKAARMDLQPAAENLVGIMNQFGYAATEADKTINVLAAGQAAGAASISQTAESLKGFGAVAKGSNATLEQSVALIQTLATKSVVGAEAGTALRGTFVRLQKAGLGYKSGQFAINEALEEAKKKVDGLRTAQEKDNYILKLLGQENLIAGKILLDNIDTYKGFTTAVTGTTEAQKAAEINGKTLAQRWEDMMTTVKNLSVDIGEKLVPTVQKFIDKVMPAISAVTEWIDKNPALAAGLLQATVAVGGLLFGVSAITGVLGIVTKATWLWTAAQWLLNTALWASGIPQIVAGIYLLYKAISMVAENTTGWGETWDNVMTWMGLAWTAFKSGFTAGLLRIQNGFLIMAEAIVGAWYWAQNKLGIISDAQYSKNMAQMAAEKNARLQAIRAVTAEGMSAAQAASNLEVWKVRGVSNGGSEAGAVVGNNLAAINTKEATQQSMASLLSGGGLGKQKLEVAVKAAPGTSAEVTKSSAGIQPVTTSTTGQR